jgi:hypothetical protein
MIEKIKGPYARFKQSDASGTTIFEPKPTSLVLIAALEIVVQDEFGSYLLLVSPRYEEVEVIDGEGKQRLPEGSHWTVPYIAKTIHSGRGRLSQRSAHDRGGETTLEKVGS